MRARGTRRGGLVSTVRTGDARQDRAQQAVAAKVNQALRGTFAQAVALEVDLVAGLNRIGHGIGSPVAHFVAAALPSLDVVIANAQSENPMPQLQLWVRMFGALECRALLFLFPVVT